MFRARALVALPGGFGTLDEVYEALNLVATRTIAPIPIVLVGKDYWRRVAPLDLLASEGYISSVDRDLVHYAESAPRQPDIYSSVVAARTARRLSRSVAARARARQRTRE